jgi:hypothetical protein
MNYKVQAITVDIKGTQTNIAQREVGMDITALNRHP